MWRETTRDAYPFPVSEGDFINRYFQVEAGGEPVAYVQTQEIEGQAFILAHHYQLRTTKSIIRQMRLDLAQFKLSLKARGINHIIGIRLATDNIKLWFHFLALFGDFKYHKIIIEGQVLCVVSVDVCQQWH